VDYETLPEYYTAIATYTTTGSSTKAAGYITTAIYTGTLTKLSQGKTIYSAIFLGEKIRTALEMALPGPADSSQVEPESEAKTEAGGKPNKNTGLPSICALLAAIPIMAILIGGAYYFMKRKVKPNEKTHNDSSGAANHGNDSSTGPSR
jgi:hypothetical protein